MIQRPATPIDSLVKTITALIDVCGTPPGVRMLMISCLDGIVAATADLWTEPSLEGADHRRTMAEALRFYADGGADGGERARWTFERLRQESGWGTMTIRFPSVTTKTAAVRKDGDHDG